MPRKGRELEILSAWLHNLDTNKYKVTSPFYTNDLITGQKRELDVLLEFKNDLNQNVKIAIQCKDWKAKVDVPEIEKIHGIRDDLNIDKHIVISKNGFTKPAMIKAKIRDIELWEADFINKDNLDKLLEECYVDLFMAKITLKKCIFIIENIEYTPKNLHKKINVLNVNEIMRLIQEPIYFSVNFDEPIEKKFGTVNEFCRNNKNFICNYEMQYPPYLIFAQNNIIKIKLEFKLDPYYERLKIDNYIKLTDSSLDKEKYRISFKSDSKKVDIGFLSDGNIKLNHDFQNNDLRIIRTRMSLNNIFSFENGLTFNNNNPVLIVNDFGKLKLDL